MKRYTFQELFQHVKTGTYPAGIEEAYDRYAPVDESSILDRAFLHQICREYGLDEQKEERLFGALDEIEHHSELLALYQFLVWDMCQERNRSDNDFYQDFDFCFESAYPDCMKFLLLLACVAPSEKDLMQRGIPKQLYEGMPKRQIKAQMKKYQESGDCSVDDFSWNKNFYTRAIYLFDRFYFIPYQFEDPFHLYRNIRTGEVKGIYNGGYAVRKDGQLAERGTERKESAEIGKEAAEDTQENADSGIAFETVFEEDEESVSGTYMNPCGFLSGETRKLFKQEWKEALNPGDGMLAFHIPEGEGYTPHHVQKSMQMAVDFYEKYFPEIEVKGFWSESWLYDNRLSILLPKESNIVSVQRRFYNYSVGGDGSMLKTELWGNKDIDPSKVRTGTALERKAAKALMCGNHFCTTSMIVLKDDITRMEERELYITDDDLEEFQRIVQDSWKKGVLP